MTKRQRLGGVGAGGEKPPGYPIINFSSGHNDKKEQSQ